MMSDLANLFDLEPDEIVKTVRGRNERDRAEGFAVLGYKCAMMNANATTKLALCTEGVGRTLFEATTNMSRYANQIIEANERAARQLAEATQYAGDMNSQATRQLAWWTKVLCFVAVVQAIFIGFNAIPVVLWVWERLLALF